MFDGKDRVDVAPRPNIAIMVFSLHQVAGVGRLANDKCRSKGETMGATAILAAVEFGKAILKSTRFSCNVVVENQTDQLLIHQSFYRAKGSLIMPELPAIPPACVVGDETYYFDEAVPLGDEVPLNAPGFVLIWKFVGCSDKWLVIVVDHTGKNPIYQHRVSYRIETKKTEPKEYWDNKTDGNFFRIGDMKEHCDVTDKPGSNLRGTGVDGDHMELTIVIS